MSDQADALNEQLRSRGVIPAPPTTSAGDSDDKSERPTAPPLELPRDGWGLDDFAREAGHVTKTNGVFRRDNVAVTINKTLGTIEPLDSDRFRTYLANLAFLYKWRAAGKDKPPEQVKVTMSKDTASGTLKADQFLFQQRELSRVNQVRQPVIRSTGKLELLAEGYDPESGIYTMPSDVVIRDDTTAAQAVEMLTSLHREFAFPDWLDVPVAERTSSLYLARQVALMVGFYGTHLLPSSEFRQGGFFTANRERSGKGLLSRMIIVPVMGRLKVRTKPDSPEEMRKLLDSIALGAASYLMLDDISPGNLKSQDLNAFMTTDWWSGRYMNTQREFEVPISTSVYMTGHNVTLTGDLAGRLLEVKLHMQEADVSQHRVQNVITPAWLASPAVRSDICSALWALIRHWDTAGRPHGPTLKPGFESWCRVFGGITTAAGIGDPCRKLEGEDSPDPEFEDMQRMVRHIMHEVKEPLVEVQFADLISTCQHLNCFEWIIEGKWHNAGKEKDERWFEPSDRCNARLGKLWSQKYGGTIFTLTDGRRVKFGQRGRGRHKKQAFALV